MIINISHGLFDNSLVKLLIKFHLNIVHRFGDLKSSNIFKLRLRYDEKWC